MLEVVRRIKELSVKLGITVSCAESCTGGYISHLLTSVPGSSLFYKGCVVAYCEEVKVKLLGVGREEIALHTVVSSQVAISMARGVSRLLGTTVGLSSTGIAGPTGALPGKPVGTVCIGLHSPWKSYSKVCRFSGDRLSVIKSASMEALRMLLELIEDAG